MNILHISPYYPDVETNHAGGVCMGKEIETLSEAHNVYVLTFISQPFDEKLAKKHEGDIHWQSVKISKLSRLFHMAIEPWMPNYFAARSSFVFAIKLIKMVRRFNIDMIHAEYASMGQYLWIKKLFPHLKFNLVEHDMTAQSFERMVSDAEQKLNAAKIAGNKNEEGSVERKNAAGNNQLSHGSKGRFLDRLKLKYYKNQLNKIIRCEKKYCLLADYVFTFNEKDKVLIADYYGRTDSIVLNPYCGIEDSVFEADDKLESACQVYAEKPDEAGDSLHIKEPFSICFLGQMGRPENDRAGKRLINIAQEAKKSVPELKVYIVGNKPTEELINKADEANKAVHESGKKWITVTGFVDDVDSYIEKCELAVFPLDMGAGIKVKVLRSMALGTPVVTGEVGAEGIDEDGEVIIFAETDEEYVTRITEFFGCDESVAEAKTSHMNHLSELSRRYIREHFSWKKSREILLGEVYKAV